MNSRVAIVASAVLLLLQSTTSAQCFLDKTYYCSETLTGDWYGNRTSLVESGITFDFDHAHFYQEFAHGGLTQRFAYGGHGDYVTNLDFGKLGLHQGLFLKIRAEHRFGENINRDTGAFLPATILADLPVAGEAKESM